MLAVMVSVKPGSSVRTELHGTDVLRRPTAVKLEAEVSVTDVRPRLLLLLFVVMTAVTW